MLQVHTVPPQAAAIQVPIPVPVIPEAMSAMQTQENSIMQVAAALTRCQKEIKYFSQAEMMR